MNMVYVGNPVLVSPLGYNTADNVDRVLAEKTGIASAPGCKYLTSKIDRAHYYQQRVHQPTGNAFLRDVLFDTLLQVQNNPKTNLTGNDRFLLILSTTKGNIEALNERSEQGCYLHDDASFLKQAFKLVHQPLIISNACASGLSAIINGYRLIKHGYYDQVIVLGYDLVSDFTLNGFDSLYALSDEVCRPFDQSRKGINLGEAVGALQLSSDAKVFKETPAILHGGSLANDANHISGPSRTGEGLVRAIDQCVKTAQINKDQIGYINAHGTATMYNDEMEAQAFNRSALGHVPLSSLKGYFGHTLGAAGIIETIVGLECIKKNRLPVNLGFNNLGVTMPLNIIQNSMTIDAPFMLKTSSGFGGINAAAIFSVHE